MSAASAPYHKQGKFSGGAIDTCMCLGMRSGMLMEKLVII